MTNPLNQYFRQPAIYLKLPSQGRFWEENSIDLPLTGEIPVMPMTAMDDLNLKTPDALFNGTGVVNLIQSCCPNITNAWNTPSTDLDAILIAIRIASYGEKMPFETKCPRCQNENSYDMNLPSILDNIKFPDFNTPVLENQLRIFLKPHTYQKMCEAGQIAYEEQKSLQLLTNSELTDQERQQLFDTQIKKIHGITIDTVTNSTNYIETKDSIKVSDPEYIREFYQNVGNHVIQLVKSKLDLLAKDQTLKPLTVTCTECEHKFETIFEFDYSSFFGNSS
jgi:hypothetical protein